VTVKCHPGLPFPICDCTALTNGTDKPNLSLAQWNRYNPPASPCLRRGKGQPLREEKGEAFVRKRVKASFDPKEFLAKVGEGKTISKYRKDQIVFSQGEVADAVFYIQQGKIKLTVVSEQGKEAVVAILGPGHFFGEGCLNGHPLRIATTRAVDECVITRLEGDHDRHHS
jgi:CRP-like cAMP-binding protein